MALCLRNEIFPQCSESVVNTLRSELSVAVFRVIDTRHVDDEYPVIVHLEMTKSCIHIVGLGKKMRFIHSDLQMKT